MPVRLSPFFALMLLAFAGAGLPATAEARAKTDLVFLNNGDRMTGEIKQLSRGILKLSTNDIGTINIEWEDVDSLSSVYQFRVEDHLGVEHFGAIFVGKDGTLEVISGGVTQTLEQLNVVAITPLEASFWQQLDGSISLGFSYTKSSSLAQLTSDINVRYQSSIRQVFLDASSISTSQKDEDTQEREDLSITYNRLFPGRFFSTTSTALQKNDELGLNARVSLATGLGADLIQTNHNQMVATAGLSGNREWSDNADGGYNLEAFFSLEHSVFRYDYPKTDITAQATVYPSLTTWGRLRSEIDLRASREIIKDLTIVLTFYDSYDNDPVDPSAQKNDYGLVSSLGWTF
jgi:Protein of unknown function, DUF481